MNLSQIKTGFRITSFKEIIVVLQNEPNDCFIEEIRKSESLTVAKLNEIFKSLANCKAQKNK